jgi:hypothetical protein
MRESEVNFAGIQNGKPSTSARIPTPGFQFASHDKRVSHGWSKTTYTEEGVAGYKGVGGLQEGTEKD